jgi:DNA mismatch endonuclease (patch repair protein)
MTNFTDETTFGNLSRSQLMAKVKSHGNSSTELKMIKLLKKNGLKGWRRNISIDGKPDFVWRKQKVALFVDGCFWHRHKCGRNLTPKTNVEYWNNRITKNKERDIRVNKLLLKKGWRVVRIWECQLKKKPEECLKYLSNTLKKNL